MEEQKKEQIDLIKITNEIITGKIDRLDATLDGKKFKVYKIGKKSKDRHRMTEKQIELNYEEYVILEFLKHHFEKHEVLKKLEFEYLMEGLKIGINTPETQKR